MTTPPLTIFADFSCPYSYVAEAALWQIAAPGVELMTRAYELYPEPTALEAPRVDAVEASALESLAASAGVRIDPVEFRPRTRKAHEAARFAREHRLERELRREIYAAYWAEHRDIGRIDVLAQLAEQVGLDPEELRIALDIDRFEADIRHDQEVARRLRIPGTPTIFIGTGRTARVVVGAHDPAGLLSLLEDAIRQKEDTSSDG